MFPVHCSKRLLTFLAAAALLASCQSIGTRAPSTGTEAEEADENASITPLQVSGSAARQFAFAGIPWSTPVDSVAAALRRLGFIRITRTADGDIEFQGAAILGYPTIGHAGITQGVLAKVSIEILVDSTQARNTYGQLREGLIKELGAPDDTLETPLALTDSLRTGAHALLLVWGGVRHRSESTMTLEVTPELTVAIEYEWSAWAVEYDRRQRAR